MGLALAMVHGIDTDDNQARPLRVVTAESDEPFAVLAMCASVTEEQKPRRVTGVVQLRRDTVGLDPLLPHARRL